MQKPLYSALKNYISQNMSSFHTPGHKGKSRFEDSLWQMDLTELPDTDSLYEASGIILESEKLIQKLFGSKRTLISSGGNTLCIQAMLRLAALEGRKLICDRNVHRSAVSAMALLGIEPIWVLPGEANIKCGGAKFPFTLKKEDVAPILRKIKSKSAVYVTSPNYYGSLCDIEGIKSECLSNDGLLLVDNAHGTHLKFLPHSLHPLDLGADMSADSAHKTLPVLTGGAWLHINDEKLVDKAKDAMALFGSTSPSYPIMASLDVCGSFLFAHGKEKFEELERKVNGIKELAISKGLELPKGFVDPTRLSFNTTSIGYNGTEFAKYLKEYSIEPELFDEEHVVLIPSPFNSEIDWERLEKAIEDISPVSKKKGSGNNEILKIPLSLPKVAMTLREAIMAQTKNISIDDSMGRVAAQIVCPCPPGVPVVMPGEVIGEFEKHALKNYGISEICVIK